VDIPVASESGGTDGRKVANQAFGAETSCETAWLAGGKIEQATYAEKIGTWPPNLQVTAVARIKKDTQAVRQVTADLRREQAICLPELISLATIRTKQPQNVSAPMTSPKRFKDDQAEDLPAELVELGRLLESIDGEKSAELQSSYNRVAESVLRRRRILGLVQEALSQLRLDVKYLMFDLEMTRRERDALQERIEGDDRGF
jgi:hypothetical protein